MRILITGGGGYIGRNLRDLFDDAGYEVLAPDHAAMDMLDIAQIEKFIHNGGLDAIIHTATRGGNRTVPDTFDYVFTQNIQIFENLCLAIGTLTTPVFLLGSGAEFDRRREIASVQEHDIFYRYPIDPYGLSKNIIARSALNNSINMYVLRLFGCFNWDEIPSRFIKACINKLKKGLPIEVHKNREMDYFYMDDVFIVIDYLLKNGGPRNINLVYNEKTTLLDIAELIHNYTKVCNSNINLLELGKGMSYSGSGEILASLPIATRLYGLEEGIKRTITKLL